ncbi:hypothetical protein Ancab_024404 [Ancistrocladus abbreviatus]
MTISASLSDTKMSWRRPKSIGWAAFDVQQKQKQILEPQLHNEPFPSLPSTHTSLEQSEALPKDNNFSVKPFTSVLFPSMNFPTHIENKASNRVKPSEHGNSGGRCSNKISKENIFSLLKKRCSWADDSLIEDILAAVNYDFEKASASLAAMISDNGKQDNKHTHSAGFHSGSNYFVRDNKRLQADKDVPLGEAAGQSEFSSVLKACFDDSDKIFMKDHEFHDEKLCSGAGDMKFMHGMLTHIPVEPEWEEDDVYLSHRKDAISMIRAASRHSKAATNSFLRGDHYSARQFSLKAQEEWLTAEKLNAKAANEILSIRNGKNGIWKLDLHGLHAAEAVGALLKRLQMIESQAPFGSLVCPDSIRVRGESVQASSSSDGSEIKKSNEQASRKRQISLEVITGRGNHSRGEAAIPAAVRSFLMENGYRFEEARPGIIMVHPKFRCG